MRPESEIAIATTGFPPNTIDDHGTPIWISDLAAEDANHTVHVVRDLPPGDALEALGAKPRLFRTCELPSNRMDGRASLPATALGVEPGTSATLLAGHVGAWTFIYDDSGATSYEDSESMSAHGRTAATSMFSINADAGLTYAVDGTQRAWVDADDLIGGADLPDMPAELRAAFEAAGAVEHDYLRSGEPDNAVCMRAICALAGLRCTLADLRGIPLLVTTFG